MILPFKENFPQLLQEVLTNQPLGRFWQDSPALLDQSWRQRGLPCFESQGRCDFQLYPVREGTLGTSASQCRQPLQPHPDLGTLRIPAEFCWQVDYRRLPLSCSVLPEPLPHAVEALLPCWHIPSLDRWANLFCGESHHKYARPNMVCSVSWVSHTAQKRWLAAQLHCGKVHFPDTRSLKITMDSLKFWLCKISFTVLQELFERGLELLLDLIPVYTYDKAVKKQYSKALLR